MTWHCAAHSIASGSEQFRGRMGVVIYNVNGTPVGNVQDVEDFACECTEVMLQSCFLRGEVAPELAAQTTHPP